MHSVHFLDVFLGSPEFKSLATLANRTLSHNAETKDFARLSSHPVRGWTGKNKAFCSPGTQNGRRVIKVYSQLVCLWPVGIFNNIMSSLNYLFQLFARPH